MNDSLSITLKPRCAVILTALEVETRAVLRHLTGVLEETVKGTVFHVGHFEGWKVAVAECGPGNVRASSMVERAIEQFKPQAACFVGIAGGVKDVAVGDVVVASKVYGYESGREGHDGFWTRPQVLLPAHRFVQRATAIRLKNGWKERLNRSLNHREPRIHVGPIAAGEKVIGTARSETARFLRRMYNDTLAVEMEGNGFLDGVEINHPVQGCIVRGISDLLDNKEEADKLGYQELAADVATAVTYEMLNTLPSNNTVGGAANELLDLLERKRAVPEQPSLKKPIDAVLNTQIEKQSTFYKVANYILDRIERNRANSHPDVVDVKRKTVGEEHPSIKTFIDKAWIAASFILTILGLCGLANGIVEWREFFDYGIIRHYIELRTWLMSFLPIRLPGWIGDYITLGLAISYPLKEIISKAKANVPSLELRLKITDKEVIKNREIMEEAKKDRDYENNKISKMQSTFDFEMLSEKDQLRFLKEMGGRKKAVRDAALTIEEFNRLLHEVESLRARIIALRALVQFLIYTRYLAIVLWPILLTTIVLFITGIIRGFDRNIIYSFIYGLIKVCFVFILIVFIAVDIKKTLGHL
jgi:nucleoside phosphorylase